MCKLSGRKLLVRMVVGVADERVVRMVVIVVMVVMVGVLVRQ